MFKNRIVIDSSILFVKHMVKTIHFSPQWAKSPKKHSLYYF